MRFPGASGSAAAWTERQRYARAAASHLPFGHGRRLARHARGLLNSVIRGWRLSGAGTVVSTWYALPTGATAPRNEPATPSNGARQLSRMKHFRFAEGRPRLRLNVRASNDLASSR